MVFIHPHHLGSDGQWISNSSASKTIYIYIINYAEYTIIVERVGKYSYQISNFSNGKNSINMIIFSLVIDIYIIDEM